MDPSYYNIGDHAEAVQIEFDPSSVSYQELLAVFWEGHDPAWQSGSRQYRNILFYHNEEQKQLAEESYKQLESEKEIQIATDLVPYNGFTLAEDYHQKHTLRLDREIMEEFNAMYPGGRGLVSSTAAARVNGYLAGNGTCQGARAEAESLGLSETARKRLLAAVCGRGEGY